MMLCYGSVSMASLLNSHKLKPYSCIFILWLCGVCDVVGAYTTVWHDGSDLVGELRSVVVKPGDTAITLARDVDVGRKAFEDANPGVDMNELQPGMVLMVPDWHVLPTKVRHGIVMNLAEMRLYYFHPKSHRVSIYPASVGRVGWPTPTGLWRIIEKRHFPVWEPPDSVRKAAATHGIVFPKVVYPGPDNPLGEHALRLNVPDYLIHGTNDPDNVGYRVTAGCLRLYPEDVKALYGFVSDHEPVQIVDMPYKFGWDHDRLYFESNVPMRPMNRAQEWLAVKKQLAPAVNDKPGVRVNQRRIEHYMQVVLGMPVLVGGVERALPAPSYAA